MRGGVRPPLPLLRLLLIVLVLVPPVAATASAMATMQLQRSAWVAGAARLGRRLRVPRIRMASSASTLPAAPPTTRRPLKFFHNDVWHVDMPPGHRFPMEKYLAFRTQAQRRLEGMGLASFVGSPLAAVGDVSLTHDRYYVQRYLTGRTTPQENQAIGFPWSRQHVERTLSSVGGTVAAMHSLFRPANVDRPGDERPLPVCGAHLAGGTHHAFADRGEGFCIFSDIAVAANVCLRDYGGGGSERGIQRILIVDLDVHQGNGNAVLFQQEPRVFTFSMHCSGNYFSAKQASDLDVEVPPGSGDEAYLALLAEHLPAVFAQHSPDLVFYQGGIDILASDRLGRLELSREGARERNRMVYEAVSAAGARLVVTAGGGYPVDSDPSSQAYQDIINAHADVYVQAAEFFGGDSN